MFLRILRSFVGVPALLWGFPRKPRLGNIVNIDPGRSRETSQPTTNTRFLAVLVGANFPTGQFFDSVRHNNGLSWS